MILVVGGTGLIGQALLREAARRGLPCRGTSPEPDAPCPLDLRQPADQWRLPDRVEQAILGVSVGGLAACEADPAGTRVIHVDAVATLADRLAARGAHITFLSSTQVFPPEARAPDESTSPAPVTEYGRQKLAVEQHLQQHIPDARIIRLTKVVSPRVPLFAGWAQSLSAGPAIRAYADLFFSPLAVSAAAAAILQIARAPEGGLYHLGAADSISYLDAARWLAVRLGADPGRIRADSAPVPNTPGSARLGIARTRTAIGFDPLPALRNLELAWSEPPAPPTTL